MSSFELCVCGKERVEGPDINPLKLYTHITCRRERSRGEAQPLTDWKPVLASPT